jgi:hypothetical protein
MNLYFVFYISEDGHIFGRNIWTFIAGRSIGKAIPLHALRGPAISRRFTLPDFKTIGT